MDKLQEEGFDAFVDWWPTGRDNFPSLKPLDERTGAAYIGFLAGHRAAKEVQHPVLDRR